MYLEIGHKDKCYVYVAYNTPRGYILHKWIFDFAGVAHNSYWVRILGLFIQVFLKGL